MKKNVLIIGAGGVGHVVAHKYAQNGHQLGKISIASSKIEKCEKIIDSIKSKNPGTIADAIDSYALNALDKDAVKQLIIRTESEIVINVCSAFVNQTVLKACIETGAAYIDTAIHEEEDKVCETPPWYNNYEWKLKNICQQERITAILGSGFDPGVVNAYAALAVRDYFDTVESIDIMDVNVGSHGRYFATNFNPEINFREFVGNVWTWQNRTWVCNEMFSVKKNYSFPLVGEQNVYLSGHDEIHSLSQNLNVPDIRFWMGFSEHYMNVFNILKNIGLLAIDPVTLPDGTQVVPLKLVKAILPDPASLALGYKGKTCIGDLVVGQKDGIRKELFLYNITDHEACYEEVESQAIAYTAGVPATAAALLIAEGIWDVGCMANIEELDPKPYLKKVAQLGLPTWIRDEKGERLLMWD